MPRKYGGTGGGGGGSYVKNSMNRSLGRVGMSLGSAASVSRTSSASTGGYWSSCSNGNSSSTSRSYVDNPINRSIGTVGLEVGTVVQ